MLLPAFCLRLLAPARGDCAAHEPCDAAPGLPPRPRHGLVATLGVLCVLAMVLVVGEIRRELW